MTCRSIRFALASCAALAAGAALLVPSPSFSAPSELEKRCQSRRDAHACYEIGFELARSSKREDWKAARSRFFAACAMDKGRPCSKAEARAAAEAYRAAQGARSVAASDSQAKCDAGDAAACMDACAAETAAGRPNLAQAWAEKGCRLGKAEACSMRQALASPKAKGARKPAREGSQPRPSSKNSSSAGSSSGSGR